MLQLNQVHRYEKVKGVQQVRLVGIYPVIRLKSGRDVPPLFIQEGKVYSEGGDEMPMEELPDWFWMEAAKLTPMAREECGLKLSKPVEALSKPPSPTPTVNTITKPERKWRCDKCAVEMGMRKKGVHIAMHARKEKRDGNNIAIQSSDS